MSHSTDNSVPFYFNSSIPENFTARKDKTSLSKKISKKICPKMLDEKLVSTKSKHFSPKESIDRMFAASPSRNQFRKLSDRVAVYAKNLSSEARKELYSAIEEKFRLVEHEDSNQAWVQRADLLDAIDVLVGISQGDLKPMPAAPFAQAEIRDDQAVLLTPYKQIKKATAIAKTERAITEAISDKSVIKTKLKEVAVLEHSKAVTTVRVLTSRHCRFENFMVKLYRILTKILGEYQTSTVRKNAKDLAIMSRGLEIGSTEYLTKKELNVETGKKELVGYYRGPKFLFGRSVHEYLSKNDWFKRHLTPEASAEYLASVEAKEAKLTVKYGALTNENGEPISRIVIANADSRVRYHIFQEGNFGETQELTGKVLNTMAEQEAQARHDNPSYYAEKYKFSTKNLLGRENSDAMEISDPYACIAYKIKKLERKIQKCVKQKNSLDSARYPQKIASFKRKIHTLEKKKAVLKSSEELYVAAQHELLGGLWRTFNRHGATQIIQRLAPADIHNYVAPLNGKPLSHKEACEILKKRIQDRIETTPIEQKEALQAEVIHFEQLIQIFEKQEQQLGRASQATIDIYGTNESVSTPAISNKSSILAQNDRKVMMFLHEDGSFSMHVFIGATGINKVDVEQQTQVKMKRGDRQGNMQFGEDRIHARDGFAKASDKMTVDSHRKLRLGDWKGGFPINGSTVLSYYLPSDFIVLPKVEEYKKAVAIGEGIERAEIELKANMGDPLLIKSEILYAQVVERNVPLTEESTLESIKDHVLNLDLNARKAPLDSGKAHYFKYDHKVLEKIQKLLKKEAKTYDEQKLLEKFESLIRIRISKVKMSNAIAFKSGMNVQDVEVNKSLIVAGLQTGLADIDKNSMDDMASLSERERGTINFSSFQNIQTLMDETDLNVKLVDKMINEFVSDFVC